MPTRKPDGQGNANPKANDAALVKRLTDKGYPAFLVDPVPGEPAALHRVRIGRYADRAEAERIARQLEREEQFTPLIIR